MAVSRSVTRAAWLPLLALFAHALEEYPRFPAWATARFGTTTPTWFVTSHIPLFVIVFAISWRASRPSPTLAASWWLLVLQTALFANGLFHIVASVLWREYSPGVWSSVFVYLPLTLFLVPKLVTALGRASSVRAAATGALLAAALTATLLLDIPVG